MRGIDICIKLREATIDNFKILNANIFQTILNYKEIIIKNSSLDLIIISVHKQQKQGNFKVLAQNKEFRYSIDLINS